MINMESLFEFYARIVLKRTIKTGKYSLEHYSKRLYIQKDVKDISEAERGIHLMPYCIPDIIIRDNESLKPVLVIDAKYKPNTRSARSDTHQLLSYALLTGAKRCGFIFPGVNSRAKIMHTTGAPYLPLTVDSLDYYELILGNDIDNISEALQYILP